MKNVLIVILLLSDLAVKGQDTVRSSKTNLFVELGGAGVVSLNLEQLFSINNSLKISGRTGIGVYPSQIIFNSKYSGIVPVTCSFIYGKIFLVEAGLGLSLGWDDAFDAYESDGPIKWYNGILGFRYQRPNKDFLFRIGYTPWMAYRDKCLDSGCRKIELKPRFLHVFGVSVGSRLRLW